MARVRVYYADGDAAMDRLPGAYESGTDTQLATPSSEILVLAKRNDPEGFRLKTWHGFI